MSEENQEGQQALTQEQKDAALAEKFRAQKQVPVDENVEGNDAGDEKPQRPEHIPEKFWDAEKGEVRVEEMAKSYAELEKAKSAPAKNEEGKQGEAAGDDEIAKTIIAHREKITAKLVAGEALTDDDYKPFAKVGFSHEDVDTYVAGLQAIGAAARVEMHKEVGGEEQYKSMIEWAKVNLSKEEIAAYNRDVVDSNDRTVNRNAVLGLHARYLLANGRDSRDVTLRGGGHGSVTGYGSGAEMRKDMATEQYKKDPAFRAQVARRVQASREAGVDLFYQG